MSAQLNFIVIIYKLSSVTEQNEWWLKNISKVDYRLVNKVNKGPIS